MGWPPGQLGGQRAEALEAARACELGHDAGSAVEGEGVGGVRFVPGGSSRATNSSAHTVRRADKAGDKRSFPGPFRQGVPVQLPCKPRAPHFGRSGRVLEDGVRDTSHGVARLSEGRVLREGRKA